MMNKPRPTTLIIPEQLWERAEKLAEKGLGQDAERVILSAAEKFITFLEERFAAEAELDEADLWEAANPDEVGQWWYSIGRATLAAIWDHPDEDIYTLRLI
ncbi:MAG: hypothetical protein ACRDH2_00505 [Anaerolineales bacterium]